jgi:hypothetical protein
MHAVLRIPYMHDYIPKLYRHQGKVIQNHGNASFRSMGQSETRHRKYIRLKLGGGQAYDRLSK